MYAYKGETVAPGHYKGETVALGPLQSCNSNSTARLLPTEQTQTTISPTGEREVNGTPGVRKAVREMELRQRPHPNGSQGHIHSGSEPVTLSLLLVTTEPLGRPLPLRRRCGTSCDPR